MIAWPESLAIYLHRDPIDFRKSINGLSVIVEQAMTLTYEQWHWLLRGLDFLDIKPHQAWQFVSVN